MGLRLILHSLFWYGEPRCSSIKKRVKFDLIWLLSSIVRHLGMISLGDSFSLDDAFARHTLLLSIPVHTRLLLWLNVVDRIFKVGLLFEVTIERRCNTVSFNRGVRIIMVLVLSTFENIQLFAATFATQSSGLFKIRLVLFKGSWGVVVCVLVRSLSGYIPCAFLFHVHTFISFVVCE